MSLLRPFGYARDVSASIDTLLDNPNCTLEDLFSEDNLINECSIHNRPLIDL